MMNKISKYFILEKIIFTCIAALSFNTTYTMIQSPRKTSSLSDLAEKKKRSPESEERISVTPPTAHLIVKNNEKYPIYLLINEKKLLDELESQNTREKNVTFKQFTKKLAILTIDILEKKVNEETKEDNYYLLDKLDAKYRTDLPTPNLTIYYSQTYDPQDFIFGPEVDGKSDKYTITINYKHPLTESNISIEKIEKKESGSFLQRITGSRISRPTTPTQQKEEPKKP